MTRIIITLSEQDRLNNHMPEEYYILSRDYEVFYEDLTTGELVQVLDLTE